MWTNFADNGKIHTCMYNVCTLYTTAVGVISPRQLARLFAPKWIQYLVQRLLGTALFASLTRHTLRLWALTRPSAQPTVPGHGKGEGRAITYEQLFICRACSNKLTAANLCDRKKNATVCARDTMTHQWVCVTRALFFGGYIWYRLLRRALFDRD